MRLLTALVILSVTLPLTGVALGSGVIASSQSAPPPSNAARVERGRQVYEHHKCATCHQIAKKGNSRFPLDGVASRLSADDLRRWITDTARMEDALPRAPAVRMSATKYRLSAVDLDGLVAYLQTLK
jgi:mono/diheme cytochrome c family protein